MRNIDAKDGNGLSDEITFQIQINLKNDNGPTRVNDNVLSVVTNGIKERVNLKVIITARQFIGSNFLGRIFEAEFFETEFSNHFSRQLIAYIRMVTFDDG